MILIDYNAIAVSTFLSSKVEPTEDALRHMILNQIRMYRAKYFKEFGEVCVVADGTGKVLEDTELMTQISSTISNIHSF